MSYHVGRKPSRSSLIGKFSVRADVTQGSVPDDQLSPEDRQTQTMEGE